MLQIIFSDVSVHLTKTRWFIKTTWQWAAPHKGQMAFSEIWFIQAAVQSSTTQYWHFHIQLNTCTEYWWFNLRSTIDPLSHSLFLISGCVGANQETAQSLRDRLRGKSVCMDHKKSLHLQSSPLRCIISESPNRRAVLRYQLNLHRHRSVIPLENHQISAKFDQNYLHSAKCQMSGNIPCLWNGVPGQHLQVVDGEDRSALWTIPEPGYIITIVIIIISTPLSSFSTWSVQATPSFPPATWNTPFTLKSSSLLLQTIIIIIFIISKHEELFTHLRTHHYTFVRFSLHPAPVTRQALRITTIVSVVSVF